MKINYKTNKLEKQLSNASDIKRYYGVIAKRLSSRIDDIVSSPNLAVLKQIPSANCHQLSGNRSKEWAVNISGNFRLIFEIDHNPIPLNDDGSVNAILITDICILEIADYH